MAKQRSHGADPAQRWSAADAYSALAAAEKSGLSLRAFAQSEGVDPQRLYWWRRRLGAGADAQASSKRAVAAEAPMFVEIGPGEVPVSDAPAIEVVLRSGRVLRVPGSGSFDAAVLSRLIELLE